MEHVGSLLVAGQLQAPGFYLGSLQQSSVQIGNAAQAQSAYSVVIGDSAVGENQRSIAIGYQARGKLGSLDYGSARIAIGEYAQAYNYGIAIGESAIAQTTSNAAASEQGLIAIGKGASAGSANPVNTFSAIAIGTDAYASNAYTVALGQSVRCNGSCSIAIGRVATIDGSPQPQYAIAIGDFARAGKDDAIAIGRQAIGAAQAIAIGYQATAAGSSGVALGYSTSINAAADVGIAIGVGAAVGSSGDYGTAIGYLANANNQQAMALGRQASATGNASIAIGYLANASGSFRSIAIGDSASAVAYSTCIGSLATSLQLDGIAFGESAYCNGESSVVFGPGARANYGGFTTANQRAVVLGRSATVDAFKAIAIGEGAAVVVHQPSVPGSVPSDGAITIGSQSAVRCRSVGSIALGALANVGSLAGGLNDTSYAIAIGAAALVDHLRAGAIGNDARSTANDRITIGLCGGTASQIKALQVSGGFGMAGVAPTSQLTHIPDPTGGATVDTEARSAINSILSALEAMGLLATS